MAEKRTADIDLLTLMSAVHTAVGIAGEVMHKAVAGESWVGWKDDPPVVFMDIRRASVMLHELETKVREYIVHKRES